MVKPEMPKIPKKAMKAPNIIKFHDTMVTDEEVFKGEKVCMRNNKTGKIIGCWDSLPYRPIDTRKEKEEEE